MVVKENENFESSSNLPQAQGFAASLARVDLPQPEIVVYDYRTQSLIRCAVWTLRTITPRIELENRHRPRHSFPISDVRTRLSSEAVNRREEEKPVSNLYPSHSTEPPTLPPSKSPTPSDLPPTLEISAVENPPVFSPSERRSSIESNFSLVSIITSTSTSTIEPKEMEAEQFEREWWKVESVSVSNPEEDRSNWKIVAW
ncbi:uncharacterized protein JCM6883_000700 [Sporobolomyces salmoneus]|uniref:uncharacterized protein n=1 Tax=Sporobolomyces salmoneus TaxID=183962 RepID=UPI00317D8E4D